MYLAVGSAGEVTGSAIRKVREDWHDWYYDEGGIYMSEAVRSTYFDAAQALEDVADLAEDRELLPAEIRRRVCPRKGAPGLAHRGYRGQTGTTAVDHPWDANVSQSVQLAGEEGFEPSIS